MFDLTVRGRAYAVRFRHGDDWVNIAADGLNEKRRSTLCEIQVEDGPPIFGQAICHPKDQFERSVGRKIALAKAIAHMARSSRRVFWEGYWKALTG